jgi:hypothetical protein
MDAFKVALKSYFLYWNYRSFGGPVVKEKHKLLFEKEELKFQYEKTELARHEDKKLEHYKKRLIVPEPDRFYSHGAGKPLLPAVLTIPSLALTQLATLGGKDLLYYQFNYNYHPVFILVRLSQIIAGLLCILLVYNIIKREISEERAIFGAAIFGLFPLSIQYFPNIHHDPIMIPFIIASAYLFIKGKFIKAGIFFGLALASKNTAILMVPVVIVYSITMSILTLRQNSGPIFGVYVKRQLTGIIIFTILGGAVLTLFANPIPYAKELSKPIIHQDTESGKPSKVHYGKILSDKTRVPGNSSLRPEVNLIKLLGYNSLFLILILAIPLIAEKLNSPLSRFSFFFLMMIFPYGLILGTGLSYRYLLFLPFTAFLAAEILRREHLKYILLLLLVIDAIFLVDPMTTKTIHALASDKTFFESLLQFF